MWRKILQRLDHVQRATGIGFLTFFLASIASAQVPGTLDADFLATPGSEWKLIFNDEFDGGKLDENKWSIGLAWTGTDGTNRHHNAGYASYIMDDDVVVSDGLLRLTTQRRDIQAKDGRVFHYTQGFIQSAGKFEAQYGYFEMRARAPVDAGPGLWPAFWTLSKGWPPEYDILEIWTSNNRIHQGYCHGKHPGVKWDSYNTYKPLSADWHTYGMEWGPGYTFFNIDGKVNLRIYGDHVTDLPQYILLNSGVESGAPPTPSTKFPNSFDVDWVRVYQREQTPLIHNAGFEQSDLKPWGRWNYARGVIEEPRTGRQSLRIDGPQGSSEQKIYGLKPGKTYVLTGWAKVSGTGDEARIGVKTFGGEERFAALAKREYSQASVEFTTGTDNYSATIYCFKSAGDGIAFFDDLTLTER